MSAPTVVERLCDVLEVVLLNGPISAADLRKAAGLSRYQLPRYLQALQDAGFLHVDESRQAHVGDRLSLILSKRGDA